MELEFSGERVVPGMAITYGVIEHLHGYASTRRMPGLIARSRHRLNKKPAS